MAITPVSAGLPRRGSVWSRMTWVKSSVPSPAVKTLLGLVPTANSTSSGRPSPSVAGGQLDWVGGQVGRDSAQVEIRPAEFDGDRRQDQGLDAVVGDGGQVGDGVGGPDRDAAEVVVGQREARRGGQRKGVAAEGERE